MPLPLLPAAAAAVGTLAATAYLNARLNLSYDLSLLSSYGAAAFSAIHAERSDRISLFYLLEKRATDSSTKDDVFLLLPKRPSIATTTTTSTTSRNTNPEDVTLEKWTYADVYSAVLRYASYLSRVHGVRKGEVVALDMVNGARFVIAWFAIWALGAVPAFVNYNLRGAALLHCLRASTARLVLVGSEDVRVGEKYVEGGEVAAALEKGFSEGEGEGEGDKKEVKRSRVEVIRFAPDLDALLDRESTYRPPNPVRSGDKLHDMAILIYTSGTTGLPKPAVVSWGKARAAATFVAHWLPLSPRSTVYTSMPLYHTSASLLALLATLSAPHTTLALAARFSASTLLHDLHATRATHLQYVGETLRYLLSTPASPLDTTHAVTTIYGNGLRPDIWRRTVARFGIRTVAEFYAATEGPGGMWNRSSNAFTAGAVSFNGWLSQTLIWGRAQAAVRVDAATGAAYRDPRTGRCVRCAAGEAGELLYKLDPADICRRFQGYFNDDEATGEKVLRDVFAPGDAWFATGDVLRRDAAGRWRFVDRLGDTFRWKGENVSTAEAATLLAAAAPDVLADVVVYGVEVPGHEGRAGCAAVVLRDGGAGAGAGAGADTARERGREAEQLARLAAAARGALPRYAVPLFVRVTPALVVTGTNKPQKHLLQRDGIDPAVVEEEAKGDRLYWLRDGRYERFRRREYERLLGGGVKL